MSIAGIAMRLILALALVYATFNPEGISYYHWAIAKIPEVPLTNFEAVNPVKVFAGLLLLVGWLVFLQATFRALGRKGVFLALALTGSVIWMLIYWNVISPQGARAITHIILVAIAVVLAVGMSWSHFTRRMSGQVDVDRVG